MLCVYMQYCNSYDTKFVINLRLTLCVLVLQQAWFFIITIGLSLGKAFHAECVEAVWDSMNGSKYGNQQCCLNISCCYVPPMQVDDGLELRKAAFECMDLLLDACPKQLDTSEFTQHLLDGLADDADIRLLSHPMLSKLCSMAETEVVSKLDKFVEPLQKTLSEKMKNDAVKHEVCPAFSCLCFCCSFTMLSFIECANETEIFCNEFDITERSA